MTPRRLARFAMILFALSLPGAAPLSAQDSASTGGEDSRAIHAAAIHAAQLVEDAAKYDGRLVEMEGEVVGDVMKRGAYAWVCLLDEGTAIGVWVECADIPENLVIGGYGMRGDLVRVRGIFHRACAEHGGDLDIHVRDFELTSPGGEVKKPLKPARAAAALFLCISGVLLTLAWKKGEAKSR